MELAHIWRWFQQMSRRRQVGMAANPLSFVELDAFCRLHLIEMTSWEVGLLMRLDDAALGAKRPEGKPKPVDTGEVSLKDTGAVRGVLSRLRDRIKGK